MLIGSRHFGEQKEIGSRKKVLLTGRNLEWNPPPIWGTLLFGFSRIER